MAAAKVNVSIWMQVSQSGGAAQAQLWQEGFSRPRLHFRSALLQNCKLCWEPRLWGGVAGA